MDPATKTSLRLTLTQGTAKAVHSEVDARAVHARLDCGADGHLGPLSSLRHRAAALHATTERLSVSSAVRQGGSVCGYPRVCVRSRR